MLEHDQYFCQAARATFGTLPFVRLEGEITPEQAKSPGTLFDAFIKLFRSRKARTIENVLFVWAVERPYKHERGHKFASTVSYIEITKRTLAGRWPPSFFLNLTGNHKAKGIVTNPVSLQQLADKDWNYSFYSRLIREHGPLRVWYATLEQLDAAAKNANLSPRSNIRAWERELIGAYRKIHGVRPLKNRRD